jgi:hypothetical protein
MSGRPAGWLERRFEIDVRIVVVEPEPQLGQHIAHRTCRAPRIAGRALFKHHRCAQRTRRFAFWIIGYTACKSVTRVCVDISSSDQRNHTLFAQRSIRCFGKYKSVGACRHDAAQRVHSTACTIVANKWCQNWRYNSISKTLLDQCIVWGELHCC